MNLFPTHGRNDKHESETGEQKFLADAPEGTKTQLKIMLDYIKLGHQIIKSSLEKDSDGVNKHADEISDKLKAAGIADKDTREAIVSIIFTAATAISPATYGEDYNKWGN